MGCINRREFLVSASAVVATSSLPHAAAARPMDVTTGEREILRIAKEQLARVGSRALHRDVVAVADFGAHSAEARFYLVDLVGGRVPWSCRVAHGTGSDPDNDGWLTRFSNMVGSNATSRGAYITRAESDAEGHDAVRLIGLDPDNSSAFDRSIALEPADYCGANHVARWGRTGRSKGAFALAPEDFGRAVQRLSGGRLLYADCLEPADAGRGSSAG